MKKRRQRQIGADELEIVLGLAASGEPMGDDPDVRTANLLRPTPANVRETQRAQTKARAMRAFAAASSEQVTTPPALIGDAPVHRASVDGTHGPILMADLEHIDPDRATAVAHRVEQVCELEVAWERPEP